MKLEKRSILSDQKSWECFADRVETDWPFRVLLPVGTHVPFHCTASGKTYLASLPAANRYHVSGPRLAPVH